MKEETYEDLTLEQLQRLLQVRRRMAKAAQEELALHLAHEREIARVLTQRGERVD